MGDAKLVMKGRYRMGPATDPWPYGEAVLAVDEMARKTVVLKMFSPELYGGKAGAGKMLAWGGEMLSVQHASLPLLHDSFEEDGRVMRVEERCEGERLSGFLDGAKRIQLPSALAFLCQIAACLDHAHSCLQIHGTLTPGGILITDKGRAKLLDFGVARALRRAAGKVRGAPPGEDSVYMAPELESDDAAPSSDLYSLAAVLFQMTTGRLPFEGPDHWGQKRRGLTRKPSALAPELPPAIDAILEKALSIDPRGRHRNCDELIGELDRLT